MRNKFKGKLSESLLERFMILETFLIWQEPRIEMHA